MPLLVVGSVALDSVETPTQQRDNLLGGSAVYFSYAASYFTPVRLVGVVGEDWPCEHTELLRSRNIDTAGLKVIPGAQTFRWRGKYHEDMNSRDTLDVQLNVMDRFDPALPEDFRRCKYLFLANGSTEIQLKVLDQCPGAKLIVADTMDLWIKTEREQLADLMRKIDGLVLNDSEAKLLTNDENLVSAGHKVAKWASVRSDQEGEHGAMFFSKHETYVLPAYPTPRVIDPTGAGRQLRRRQ